MLLEDSSVIRLPSSAAVKIAILRKNALESSPEVQLDLVRGRIELEVYKGRAQTTPFEVRTPLSITGVRGTEFRVGYAPAEQTGQVEVLGGVVQAMGLSDAESKKGKVCHLTVLVRLCLLNNCYLLQFLNAQNSLIEAKAHTTSN
jgi:hypothetical protein